MHVHGKSEQPTKIQFCAIQVTDTLQLRLAGHRTDPRAIKCKTNHSPSKSVQEAVTEMGT